MLSTPNFTRNAATPSSAYCPRVMLPCHLHTSAIRIACLLSSALGNSRGRPTQQPAHAESNSVQDTVISLHSPEIHKRLQRVFTKRPRRCQCHARNHTSAREKQHCSPYRIRGAHRDAKHPSRESKLPHNNQHHRRQLHLGSH